MEDNSVSEWSRKLSLGLCNEEMLIFSKWIYRHRNQQRSHKCFQRLLQIEKSFKKYHKRDYMTNIKDTIKECINSSSDRIIIPSTVLTSLQKTLSDCLVYVVRLLNIMELTFCDLYQRIEIGHLLYTYIVIAASLSRLWFYLRSHVLVLCELQYSISSASNNDNKNDTIIINNIRQVLKVEDYCYLPLRMRPDPHQKKDEQLQVSLELQAIRERDIMMGSPHLRKKSNQNKNKGKQKRVTKQSLIMKALKFRKLMEKIQKSKKRRNPTLFNLKLKRHPLLRQYVMDGGGLQKKKRKEKREKKSKKKKEGEGGGEGEGEEEGGQRRKTKGRRARKRARKRRQEEREKEGRKGGRKRQGVAEQVTKLQNKFVVDINKACDNLVPVSDFYINNPQ